MLGQVPLCYKTSLDVFLGRTEIGTRDVMGYTPLVVYKGDGCRVRQCQCLHKSRIIMLGIITTGRSSGALDGLPVKVWCLVPVA
jgi:hypothetical protein